MLFFTKQATSDIIFFMQNSEKISEIFNFLDTFYSDIKTELKFVTPYQLLVAVILSAQCTDKRVNMITPKLFELAPTPQAMLQLGSERLKEIIASCGFYNQKSKSILSATTDIINIHNGNVPDTLDELVKLRGVGRKTANVVLAVAFNQQTIAVDTHVLRVSKRLELCDEKCDANKCETELLKIVPINRRSEFHSKMVLFGRYFCKAQKPNCSECRLQQICKYCKQKQ